MSDKVYEIAHWPVKEASSTVVPLLELIRDQKSSSEIRSGLQTETPAVWMVAAWSSIEEHLALIANKELAETFFARLRYTCSDPSKVEAAHARFFSDPSAAFNAPITEIMYIVAKEGVAREKVTHIQDDIVAYLTSSESIALGATYGTLVEKPETFLFVVGWSFVEDHLKAFQSAPFAKLVTELNSVAETQYLHVGFTLFSS